MASSYVHNYAEFGKQVMRAGFMRAVVVERAELVKAVAEASAPVGDAASGWYDGGREPGEYKAAFSVSTGITSSYGPGSRVFARVSNDSDHALAVEYGYGPVPRYRTLGRALIAAGGDARFKP